MIHTLEEAAALLLDVSQAKSKLESEGILSARLEKSLQLMNQCFLIYLRLEFGCFAVAAPQGAQCFDFRIRLTSRLSCHWSNFRRRH